MPTKPFIHLHVHSHYSLLDGAVTVGDLVDEAVQQEMPSLALTDHGVLYGAIEFYTKAHHKGVNPILGCEAYIVRGDATTKPAPGEKRKRHHITLLAKNNTGWKNLCHLSSQSWIKGFNRKPCIDKNMLAQHSEGLIALSGCMSGEVAQAILAKDEEAAIRAANEYASILGQENLYLEVMSNGVSGQKVIQDGMNAIAQKTGLPLVATNDIHYRCPGGHITQDALICIGTGQRMHDEPRRYKIDSEELYFRSSEEMAAIFDAESQEYRSTTEIADRCKVTLDLDSVHLPSFDVPTDETPEKYLHRLCEEGLASHYGEITPEVRDRFEKEFQVITSTGFTSYFLIVWDLIRHAREQNIPVGPGRGSAAGSIVSYALNITRLDPLKYGLLFERFLNADRISMPDIDIDFCRDRRDEIIAYAREKYGNENVCQIITFGTIAARAAIRDAGRVLDIPLAEVDKIAKQVPETQYKMTLAESIEQDSTLAETFKQSKELKELQEVGLKIEGMARNASTHAAGVVITDEPLVNFVPLCVVKGQVNTQIQMSDLDKIGLLKMDFLGLKNLTTLAKAAKLVSQTHGVTIDYETLPLDDHKVFNLLKAGDCAGVFQLESSGMRELVTRLQPDCFEDIIALIALYRPGPLQTGMTDSFVHRKHGREPIQYAHPMEETILKDTYGCMIYQEQIMLLAQTLGGLSLNEADGLRKAMGKKDSARMNSYEPQFLTGAEANGIPPHTARNIWVNMSRFAEYGFNKSHSAAYGVITYRTAYMKAHYPGEYLAALMSSDAGDTDRLLMYFEDASQAGMEIKPPHINASLGDFTLEEDAVRFGLNAIKGIGKRVVRALLKGRDSAGGSFNNIAVLLNHVDVHNMNRASFDALIKSGALDDLHPNRTALLESSTRLLRDAARQQKDHDLGQEQLFAHQEESGNTPSIAASLDEAPPTTISDIIAMEKEALGFCVTVDALAEWRPLLRILGSHRMAEIQEDLPDGTKVTLGGSLNALRVMQTRRGKKPGQTMALCRITSLGGSMPIVIFAKLFAKHRDLIEEDRVVLLQGTLDRSRDEPSLLVNKIQDLSDPSVSAKRLVVLNVQSQGNDDRLDRHLAGLRSILPRYPGPSRVCFSIDDGSGEVQPYRLGKRDGITLGTPFIQDVEELLGADAIHLR